MTIILNVIVAAYSPAEMASWPIKRAEAMAYEARGNGGAGFMVADGAEGATQPVRVSLSGITSMGNLFGVQIPSGGVQVELTVSDAHIFSNTNHGVVVSATPRACIIRGSVIRGNGSSGVYINGEKVQISDCQINQNTRYGVEEGASSTRMIVGGATYVQGNILGAFKFNDNGRHMLGRGVIDYNIGSNDIIASNATITLPAGGDYFAVTGTTNITSVTKSRRGRVVTLHFTGALTVEDGTGNLKLASNFATTSSDTLTLVCDGTDWSEVARSVN